jgi:hypothetical protein
MKKVTEHIKNISAKFISLYYFSFIIGSSFHFHQINLQNGQEDFSNHRTHTSHSSDPFSDVNNNCTLANFISTKILPSWNSSLIENFLSEKYFTKPDYFNKFIFQSHNTSSLRAPPYFS